MSWDYFSLLARYAGHRVCVAMHHQMRLWGTLDTVGDDGLRLLDTILSRETDEHSWYQHSQFSEEDGAGLRYPETVIRLDQVLAVTCVDGDVEALPEIRESAEPEMTFQPISLSALEQIPEVARFSGPAMVRFEVGLAFDTDQFRDGIAGDICDRLREVTGLASPTFEVVQVRQGDPHVLRVFVRGNEAFCDRTSSTDTEKLQAALRHQAHRLVTCDLVEEQLERLIETGWAALVRETTPGRMTLPLLVRILRNLVADRVPMNDLSVVLEALVDAPPQCTSTQDLAKSVRQALREPICDPFRSSRGNLTVFKLEARDEATLTATSAVRLRELLADRPSIPLLVSPAHRDRICHMACSQTHIPILAEDELPAHWPVEVLETLSLAETASAIRLLPAA